MNTAILRSLEQIINVTSMANKWLMWCEQNFPNQSVFVPSVFQMRDAYGHVIKMFALGMQDQGANSDNPSVEFDPAAFFDSEIVSGQLLEIASHSLRAFFDTADYIATCLIEACETADSDGNSKFLLLRETLVKFNPKISELRAEKSNLPNEAYEVAVEWDSILQLLTCAYSFGNNEQILNQHYLEVSQLILLIEEKFDADTIKEYDHNFYQKK